MNNLLKCVCPDPDNGRRDVLLLLATLGVPLASARAQDPTKTEPRTFRIMFENDKVRVLEYTARPGLGVCGAGKHSHPDHVTVTLTPAKVKVTRNDGSSFVNDLKAGEAFWEPASTHMAENVGGSGARMVLVEIKDKNWKPATG
jgi:beta-alanine degradation protein BauB